MQFLHRFHKRGLAWVLRPLFELAQSNTQQLETIMSTQKQLVADLVTIGEQLKKTITEIRSVQGTVTDLHTKIDELEAVIAAGGEASQSLIDAVAAVKAQAQLVDEQIPDLPTLPPIPAAPVITSPLTASGQVGQSFQYQTTALPVATSFAATFLPDGLSIDPTTGLISGTPVAPTVEPVNVVLNATNDAGTDSKVLLLKIAPTA